MDEDIHKGQTIHHLGAADEDAKLVVILLHGRGSNAESMIPLAESLYQVGISFLIPQAALNRWYPQTAFGPLEANEPDLSSALSKVDSMVERAIADGFAAEQIFLGGFSQGACLASEYVARNPRQYGGLFVLSGALIGPPSMPRTSRGSLEGTPVFIGGSDVDPWIKHEWMMEAASVFRKMGADVDFRTYPGTAHTVNQDEIDQVRGMLANSIQASPRISNR
jgi:predicted esterase